MIEVDGGAYQLTAAVQQDIVFRSDQLPFDPSMWGTY